MKINEIMQTDPQGRDFNRWDKKEFEKRTPFKPKYQNVFTYAGKKGELTLWVDNDDPYVFVAYSGKKWAMTVNGQKTKVGMQIATTTSNPTFRGHKMGPTVYKMIARKLGSLTSDVTLSPIAVNIWRGFENDPQVELEVVNVRTGDRLPADYDTDDKSSFAYRILPK